MPTTDTTVTLGTTPILYPTNLNPPPSQPPTLTQERILELTRLAYETIKFLDKHGVKKYERCQFGTLIRNLMEFPSKDELKK